MERPPERHADQRQELPELQIVPLERRPEIGGEMPPDIVNADISKILDKQRKKDKPKKTPHLNS